MMSGTYKRRSMLERVRWNGKWVELPKRNFTMIIVSEKVRCIVRCGVPIYLKTTKQLEQPTAPFSTLIHALTRQPRALVINTISPNQRPKTEEAVLKREKNYALRKERP